MRSALIFSFATLVLLAGAALASAGDTGLETLTEWMTGSFSSSAQAEAGPYVFTKRIETSN